MLIPLNLRVGYLVSEKCENTEILRKISAYGWIVLAV